MTITTKDSIPARASSTACAEPGRRSKLKSPGKGKPTPKRRDSERARREARRPPEEVVNRFAVALSEVQLTKDRDELRKRQASWGKDDGGLPDPTFTRDELKRLRAGK